MRRPGVLYAFFFLATIDSQRLTSGRRRFRDLTQDQVCRQSPHSICHNEQCVPVENARCDGVTQCRDGSDEINCPSSGCVLPQQPVGGGFQIGLCAGNSCNIVVGRAVPSGTFLTYRCDNDYTLAGNNISFCLINRWYLPPSCVKTCPVLRLEGIDISCRYNGENVPCEPTIVPGTKATLVCKNSYKIPLGNDPGYRELTCLHEGVWDRPVFHCIPECGTAIAHGSLLVVNGRRAKLGAYPWHVGVYEKTSTEDLEQICAGTLISPDLVISAAHCFWDDTIRTVKNVSRFAVAVGKYYRSYTTLLDPYVQKSLVKNIDVAPAYFGWSGNYAHDVALVRVKTPFNLSTLIRPICMDWDNRHEDQQLQFGQVGKAVGWGKTASGAPSVELQEINLPYIPRQNCVATVPEAFKGFVTADKFCAGYLNGSSLCEGDSGGGLFFKFDGLWFLRGIVSVSPTFHGTCDNNFYTAFTSIGNFLGWIRTICFRSGNFGDGEDSSISYDMRVAPIGDTVTTISLSSCLLPEQPADGRFELGSCTGQCNVAPGSRVPINSSLIYRCDEEYILIGNNITVCFNNEWDSPPTCLRKPPSRVNGDIYPAEGVTATYSTNGDMHGSFFNFPKNTSDETCRISRGNEHSAEIFVVDSKDAKPGIRWYLPRSCVKETCPVLKPVGVDISCRFNDSNVPCEPEIVPGTRASVACKFSYKIPPGNGPGYGELICLPGGTWDRAMFHCILECGKASANGRSVVVNGRRVTLNTYPWHVGVYKRISPGNFEQICAGTLISPDFVISAAHCFWDETRRTVTNTDRFTVAVGKYHRPYMSLLDPYEQRSQVENINVSPAYIGSSGNYAHNIALVRVSTPFTFSTVVKPICIDWENSYEDQQLQSGQVGKAVGWGKTASENSTVVLQGMDLSYTSRHNCFATRPKGGVTADTFYAGCGSRGSSIIGEGDRGGGLFFKFSGRWYLRGIISFIYTTPATRNIESSTVLTNVGNHLEWIRTIYVRSG